MESRLEEAAKLLLQARQHASDGCSSKETVLLSLAMNYNMTWLYAATEEERAFVTEQYGVL